MDYHVTTSPCSRSLDIESSRRPSDVSPIPSPSIAQDQGQGFYHFRSSWKSIVRGQASAFAKFVKTIDPSTIHTEPEQHIRDWDIIW